MSSSKLSVGIVGLPNVGKSTFFNALLRKQQAYAANFPFATIEPNVGIVPVPDKRLEMLANIIKSQGSENKKPPVSPATMEFIDIAGLIAGAHKGEGLGNKFLHNIREVNVICHVLRVFDDENILKAGSVDPKADLETIETELSLTDLSTIEKQVKPRGKISKEEENRWSAVQKIRELLNNGQPARDANLTNKEMFQAKLLNLLTMKPILIVLNIGEKSIGAENEIERKFASDYGIPSSQVVALCAKTEEDLSALTQEETNEYLKELGVFESGLERVIKKAFSTLNLINFLTMPILLDGPASPGGVWEVKAWTIKKGTKAPQAAGAIHTDFEKKFIKAEVCNYDEFVSLGGWKNAREQGKVRQEGANYVVQDGDVIEFKVGMH